MLLWYDNQPPINHYKIPRLLHVEACHRLLKIWRIISSTYTLDAIKNSYHFVFKLCQTKSCRKCMSTCQKLVLTRLSNIIWFEALPKAVTIVVSCLQGLLFFPDARPINSRMNVSWCQEFFHLLFFFLVKSFKKPILPRAGSKNYTLIRHIRRLENWKFKIHTLKSSWVFATKGVILFSKNTRQIIFLPFWRTFSYTQFWLVDLKLIPPIFKKKHC